MFASTTSFCVYKSIDKSPKFKPSLSKFINKWFSQPRCYYFKSNSSYENLKNKPFYLRLQLCKKSTECLRKKGLKNESFQCLHNNQQFKKTRYSHLSKTSVFVNVFPQTSTNEKPNFYLNANQNLNRQIHTSSVWCKVIPFNLTDIGEGIREVAIKVWNDDVKVGSQINEFDTICEVESDKANVSITSRYSGIVKKIYYKTGDVAFVGKPLIDIDVKDNTHENHEHQKVEEVPQLNDVPQSQKILESNIITSIPNRETSEPKSIDASLNSKPLLNKSSWKYLALPSVRRMIKLYGINPNHIKPTGKDGRILKEDVVRFMNSPIIEEDIRVREVNETKVIPIQGYVRGMFKSMTEANTIPSLRLTDEIDTTLLKQVRRELNDYYQNKLKLKMTYMPFFIKALSLCITEYPILNATIDNSSENIIVNNNHNVCVAIDTEHGLVVPNIKNVHKLSLIQIAKELIRLQVSGYEGKVSPIDLQNGTICISNVGNVGGTLVQPIIIPKQVCILAFGKMQTLPRFDADMKVVPKSVLNITWAADHRVVDGATVARASALWKTLMESPNLLLAN